MINRFRQPTYIGGQRCYNFFHCRFTQRELKEGKSHITELTDKWFKEINRDDPLLLSDSEEEFIEQD